MPINPPLDLAIITEEFRPSKKGGIATWAHALAMEFGHRSDYKVTVFAKSHDRIENIETSTKLPFTLLPMRGRDWGKFKKWYVTYYLWRFLKDHNNPLVLAATWELARGTSILKDKYPHILITAAHGLEVSRLKWDKYKKRQARFTKILKISQAVVAVSNFTQKEIFNNSEFKNRSVNVITNGVDEKVYFPQKSDQYKSHFGLNPHSNILLTLSRIIPRKGHDIVIKSLPKVIRDIPQLLYVIAGAGERGWETYLRELSKSLGLQNHVIFLGYVSDLEKVQLYNLCHVYIMVSKDMDHKGDSEGFGITFLEANACGKPVIGSRSGGIPEAVADGQSGLLVEPGNIEETEQAIIRLFQDKKLYQQLSIKGKNRILDQFTWLRISEQYHELFQSLLNKA